MTDKKDGGNAFPVLKQHAFNGDILGSSGGMTLRQYYAAAALQGLLSRPMEGEGYASAKDFGEAALDYADAMIAAEQEDWK